MARVITNQDWMALGLPGRNSHEIVSQRTGSQTATLRYVEIPVAQAGDAKRTMHLHHGVEEIIWVVGGEGVFETPAGRLSVRSGDAIQVPADEPHVTRNVSSEPLRLLCFFPHPDVGRQTENLQSE